MYVCMYVYIYIYIYREIYVYIYIYVYVYIYIYTYIHMYRERSIIIHLWGLSADKWTANMMSMCVTWLAVC